MTRKQKMLSALAGGLVILVGLVYLRPLLGALPTPGGLRRQEQKLQQLRGRLEKLQRNKSLKDAELDILRIDCGDVLWPGQDRVLSTVVQNELQTIARQERSTLRSVGSPRTKDVGTTVRAVEVSVRLQGDMKDISRFLARVDASVPRFFWTACTIRPINVREPDMLDLTGRIEAYFVVGEGEQLIFAAEEL